MTYYDKNGSVITIGDHVVPDAGQELVIVGEMDADDAAGLLGRQVANQAMLSLLTQDDLTSKWTLVQ